LQNLTQNIYQNVGLNMKTGKSRHKNLWFSKILGFALFFLAIIFFTGCDRETRVDPQPFGLPVSYPLGKKPATVITKDMNNDEFPDVLVPNSASDNLYYYEGNGDGTFKPAVIMNTGREPVALDSNDFDGDGIPDIAICNYGDGNISIILGQKDGLFRVMEPVHVGRLPISIGSGDFNNDEKIDLAVTMRFDKLIILLGNGDGTFKLAEAYMAPGTPAAMSVTDYNNDTYDDIAVAFNAMKIKFIRVYLGNGDGTFKPPELIRGGHQSSFITHYDMNQDGQQDLITSSPITDSLTLFLGDGKGSFKPLQDFAAEKSPSHIVAGEFSGDKIPDLVVNNQRDGSVSVLEGRGDGTFYFPHYNYPVGRNPRAIAGADFNSDGMKDLAVILYDSHSLVIIMRKIDNLAVTNS
jgi:hypothetical protein